MHQLDRPGLVGHAFDPIHQALLIGVGRVAGKRVDLGLDRFALAVENDISAGSLAVLLDGPAGRACGLVADEEDVVSGVVDALFADD
jgi:hypothetical protein